MFGLLQITFELISGEHNFMDRCGISGQEKEPWKNQRSWWQANGMTLVAVVELCLTSGIGTTPLGRWGWEPWSWCSVVCSWCTISASMMMGIPWIPPCHWTWWKTWNQNQSHNQQSKNRSRILQSQEKNLLEIGPHKVVVIQKGPQVENTKQRN